MSIATLRLEPAEDNCTYFVQADHEKVILWSMDDQTVNKVYHGKQVDPLVGEQIEFPLRHIEDVINALVEILHKSVSSDRSAARCAAAPLSADVGAAARLGRRHRARNCAGWTDYPGA